MDDLFSNINFNVDKSPDSSIDFKLLDTVCDHRVLNELSLYVGSGNIIPSSWNDGVFYSQGDQIQWGNDISPEDFFVFKTLYPVYNQYLTLYQNANSSFSNPIVENFVVPSGANPRVSLLYSPKPNSLTIRQKTTSTVDEFGETQTIYYPFSNYTIAQLPGLVTFTNKADIGITIEADYVSMPKKIPSTNKVGDPNWQIIGYDQNQRAIFKVFGRALLSDKSRIYTTYTTTSKFCTKCAGNNILNDLDFNEQNRLKQVYDFSKLIQDFFKRFLTKLGSNPLDSTDGTQIETLVGLGQKNPTLMETLIRTETVNLINQIRTKQNSQNKVQGISLAEQIMQINRLTAIRDNATDITVNIDILSKSNQTAQLKKSIQRS